MKTTGIKGVVFVVTLAFLYDPVRGDTEVTCVLMESCILPCKFQPGNGILIYWIHVTAGDTYVHSYYYNEDQFKNQDQRFRNRTSLFKEQISGGNASLRLTQVEIGDQGKYKCHTSILDEPAPASSFINLKVEAAAPVTPISVLSFTQLNKKQDRSDNEDKIKDNKNTKIIIGVVSGILVVAVIGGLTGFFLRRRRPENPPNPTAEELDRLDGGEQRARPNGEADPLNNQE